MIKKIDIAGLQLDNYTVREMLMRVDRRISEKILTTIEEVNMDTLALAEFDEEVKQSLEACDYTVIADEGILRAASADTLQRRHEIEDHDFFYELFKRLERNDKKIFVIAESQKAVDEAEEFLLGLFDRARISGKGVLDDSPGCSENLVNEINIVSPDVIASFLPSPSQEKFLLHNREKLLMNLWYGIGNNKFMGKKHGFIVPPVNEFDNVIIGNCNMVPYETDPNDFPIQINHYLLKSHSEYIKKSQRGDAFFSLNPRDEEYFKYHDSKCLGTDDHIYKHSF